MNTQFAHDLDRWSFMYFSHLQKYVRTVCRKIGVHPGVEFGRNGLNSGVYYVGYEKDLKYYTYYSLALSAS